MKPQNELRMLREIVQHAFTGGEVKITDGHAVCFFCKNPLLAEQSTTFGHHSHLKTRILKENGDPDAITIHHANGNHDDNRPSNRKLAHRSCHKRHHMTEMHRNGAIIVPAPQVTINVPPAVVQSVPVPQPISPVTVKKRQYRPCKKELEK